MYPKVLIIIASTRRQRLGPRFARWVWEVAAEGGALEAELVDLAELGLPFLSDSPLKREDRDGASVRWAEMVGGADGFVIVTPEYNHGYPAPLKNALDHLHGEWCRKPVAFVSYGGQGGGARAVEQLRAVVVELEMVPLRQQVVIPRVWEALTEDGVLHEENRTRDARHMLDELAWWAGALRVLRGTTPATA
jgi:NAD(P)H-dependent FMN reductase